MRRATAFILSFATSLTFAGERAQRQAILRVLEARAVARHSTPHMDWENAFGVRRVGPEARQRFLKDVVVPTTAAATYLHQETRVTLLSSETAVADEYGVLKGQTDPQGNALADRHIRTTYVLQYLQGRWRIAVQRIADLRD
jgi:ketosteroid isomerase-like protein